MNKISIKKNLSSMQVLKTLQVLLQGNFTMQELIERLNKSEEEPVFNNSVIRVYSICQKHKSTKSKREEKWNCYMGSTAQYFI